MKRALIIFLVTAIETSNVFALSAGATRALNAATNDGLGGLFTGQNHGDVAFNGTHYFGFYSQSSALGSFTHNVRLVRVKTDGGILDANPENVGGTLAAGSTINAAAANNGTVMVVWEDTRNSGAGRDVYGALVGADGKRIGPAGGFAIATLSGNQGYPNVAFSGNQFLVAWTDGSAIHGRRIALDGSLLDGAATAAATVFANNASSVTEPAIAGNGAGDWLLAWDGTSGADVRCQRISSAGALIGAGPVIVNDLATAIAPAVDWNGTHWLITWGDNRGTSSSNIQHIRGARVNGDGTLADAAGGFEIAAFADADEDFSSVASNGTDWLVAWAEKTAPSGSLVTRFSARVVEASGAIQGTAADRGTPAITTGQFGPKVASDGSGWLMTATAVNTSVTAVGRAYVAKLGDLRTAQSITFPEIDAHFLNDAPFIIPLLPKTSAGLSVTVENLTPSIIGLAGSIVTPLAMGTASIRVSHPGDSTRAAVSVTRSFEILGNRQMLSLPTLPTFAGVGSVLDLNGATTSGPGSVVVQVVSGPASLNGTDLTITGTGRIVIRFSAAGDANNAAATFEHVINADSTLPSVSIATPTPSQTLSSPAVSITGKAGDDLGVANVEVRLNNRGWMPATQTGSGVSVSWTFDAPAGSLAVNAPNTIEARARDFGGHLSTLAHRVFTYSSMDTEIPGVVVSTPSAGGLVSGLASAILAGTATDNTSVAEVQASVNGGPWIATSGTTSWSLGLNLSLGLRNGPNTVVVRALDSAGNVSATVTRLFKFAFAPSDDKTAPSVAITSPAAPAQSGDFSASGTGADNVGVSLFEYRINGGAWRPTDTSTGGTAATWSITSIANPGGPVLLEVRSTDTFGNVSKIAKKLFSRTGTGPVIIETYLDGVPSSAPGTIGKTANGAIVPLSAPLSLTAKANTGFAFVNWQVIAGSETIAESRIPSLKFPMRTGLRIIGHFTTTNFVPEGAAFSGIVSLGDHLNSGHISVNSTKTGSFTGTLIFGSDTFKLKGALDANGEALLSLPRKGRTPLSVRIVAEPAAARLAGVIDLAGSESGFEVPRHTYFPKGTAAPQSGVHNFALQPGTVGGGTPEGSSTGTFVISANGSIKVSGKMADGSPFSAASAITETGGISFGAMLYKGAGKVLAEFEFTQTTSGSLIGLYEGTGAGLWAKQATTTGFATNAFTLPLETLSSEYFGLLGQDPFELLSTAHDVDLKRFEANEVLGRKWRTTIQPSGAVGPFTPADETPSLKLDVAKGTFSGKFTPAPLTKPAGFSGVIIQSRSSAFGSWIRGTNEIFGVAIEAP